MIEIFGHKLNPDCSMDEFQKQAEEKGLGDGVAMWGYRGKSNLKYGDYWKGGCYNIVGDYYGKKVEVVIWKKPLRWGMERKTIWKKHWWYST